MGVGSGEGGGRSQGGPGQEDYDFTKFSSNLQVAMRIKVNSC